MRLVSVGISSTGRPTQKRSKPRSSGIWKYALATSPSGSRKISILPWPSSLVTGSIETASTGRPTQKRSKPRSSGIWKYALATSPSGSRKISILPWPSSLVTGSIVIRSIARLLPAVLPGRAAAAQQRTRQAEAVELAHRVGDAVEHLVDLLGLGSLDHRGEGRNKAGAVVDNSPSRAVACLLYTSDAADE